MLQNGALFNLLPSEMGQGNDSPAFQPLDGFRTDTPDSVPGEQHANLDREMNDVADQNHKYLDSEPMDNSMLLDIPDPFDLGQLLFLLRFGVGAIIESPKRHCHHTSVT